MADTNNHCIRKITVGGEVTTIAGSGTEGHHDAIGTAAQFEYPNGVAVDGTGNLYVADTNNHRIRKITITTSEAGVVTTAVTTITGSGSQGHHDATGTDAEFNGPSSVTVDSSGNLYVVEYTGNRIRKITITTSEAGVVTAAVTTIAGSGTEGHQDATGTAAQFSNPTGVAVDSSGNLYVADTDNHGIQKIIPGEVGNIFVGSDTGTPGFVNGTGTYARFRNPTGVAVDSSGNLYVADNGNHRIRRITSAGEVTTLAGSTEGHHDATGKAARFRYPSGVAVVETGGEVYVYVADRSNDRIRKITPGGEVTTLAGSGSQGDDDGTGTEAEFDGPSSVTVDSSGNLYVVEYTGNRIRKITITTSEAGVVTAAVTTLAGSGSQGYTDATGTAAQFDGPLGVAVDSSGNLYVADTDNHRIRKIEYK